jgi:hypothetical protein
MHTTNLSPAATTRLTYRDLDRGQPGDLVEMTLSWDSFDETDNKTYAYKRVVIATYLGPGRCNMIWSLEVPMDNPRHLRFWRPGRTEEIDVWGQRLWAPAAMFPRNASNTSTELRWATAETIAAEIARRDALAASPHICESWRQHQTMVADGLRAAA